MTNVEGELNRPLKQDTLMRLNELSDLKNNQGYRITVTAKAEGPCVDKIVIKQSGGSEKKEYIEQA